MIVPHVGWNSIITKGDNNLVQKNMNTFYFVHSFYALPKYDKDIIGYTVYDEFRFCSAVMKENVLGCQFHPEKSGINGLSLLEDFFK